MYCTKCNSAEQGTERMLNFCFGGKVLNIVTVLMVVTNSSHIWLFPWEYYGVLNMDKRDQVLHIWSRLRWSRVSQVGAVCVCVCVCVNKKGWCNGHHLCLPLLWLGFNQGSYVGWDWLISESDPKGFSPNSLVPPPPLRNIKTKNFHTKICVNKQLLITSL